MGWVRHESYSGTPEIATPGDLGFSAATAVFNSAAVPEPAAAVVARTVEHVRTAIRYARDRGLAVRVHSTGHGAASVRPVRGAMLIRTAMDGAVTVDPGTRTAWVPAGKRWQDVVLATEPYGLAAAHGSSGTVGVVGHALRGGLSPYGRLVGLGANGVRAVELVTADGEHRRVDAGADTALFWALRGGGGGFGVVTAVELDLFPVTGVITGAAFWPGPLIDRLLAAWLDWTRDAPVIATTSVRVMNLPDVPDVPPELAGRATFVLDGVVHAGDQMAARRSAADLLGPLRTVGAPLIDTWQEDVPSAVLRAHLDPAGPLPIIGDHMLLTELNTDGVTRLLDVLGDGSPLVGAGLRQLSGAYANPPTAGGALDRLDASYSYAGSGLAFDQDATAALRAHCAKVRRALDPWNTGRVVPSFVEDVTQPQQHLDTAVAAEVDRIRARVDPDGLFRDDVSPTHAGQE